MGLLKVQLFKISEIFLGVKQKFFHGKNASNHYRCQCSEDQTCPLIGCNCNMPGNSEDHGTITLKSALPIKELFYGPLKLQEGEKAGVKIGAIRCTSKYHLKIVLLYMRKISHCLEFTQLHLLRQTTKFLTFNV